MSWLDIIILLYIMYSMMKGYTLGLILSLFNLFQVIISLLITKSYYRFIYDFILENRYLYNILEKISYFILRIIFFRKDKIDPSFLPNLLDTSIMDLIILGFSILFVYKISTIIIDILYSLISFLLEIKIFKKINKYGGMLFGFFTGILIVLIISQVMRPIFLLMPDLLVSKAFLESRILKILMDNVNLLKEVIVNEKTRYFSRNIISIYRNFISTI